MYTRYDCEIEIQLIQRSLFQLEILQSQIPWLINTVYMFIVAVTIPNLKIDLLRLKIVNVVA